MANGISGTYTRGGDEKPGAFVLRVLREEGAVSPETAILKSAFSSFPGNFGVTFHHAQKAGHVAEIAAGTEENPEPAFYITAEGLAPPAEAPAPATESSDAAQAAPAEIPTADVPAFDGTIAAPDHALHLAEPGITLRSVICGILFAAEAPLTAAEVARRAGVDSLPADRARDVSRTVAMTCNVLCKDGWVTRVRSSATNAVVYSPVAEHAADLVATAADRKEVNATWAAIRAGSTTVKALAAALGKVETAVRASVRSLVNSGWVTATREGGSMVLTALDAQIEVDPTDVEDDAAGDAAEAPAEDTGDTAADTAPTDPVQPPSAPQPDTGALLAAFRGIPNGDARKAVLTALGDLFHALAAL